MWGLKGVITHERGAHLSHNVHHQGKTSIPLGGRNFRVKRGCKGLEEVGKGWEGYVMLRESLSNLISSFYILLTHYYKITFFSCLDFSN
jgi:hypothetical protein